MPLAKKSPTCYVISMGYLVGTDEAGYGPNLGPLIISATVWEIPNGVREEGLFHLLDGIVANSLPKKNDPRHDLPVFADSKILYSPGKGLHLLEHGLWAAWRLLGWEIGEWRDLWEKLAPNSLEVIDHCPFYRGFNKKFHTPPQTSPDWHERFSQSGVQLLSVRSRAVFPSEFNGLMDKHESKGAALSHLTLSLIAEMIGPLSQAPISVLCDKHGGRDRYAALLNEHFPDNFIEVRDEGRQVSRYRFGPPERKIEFQFRAKAESHLPAALASMASKYLREMAMEAFNAFWIAHLPNLSPTAGYPQDAKRFRVEIAEKQRELGIDDTALWRKK